MKDCSGLRVLLSYLASTVTSWEVSSWVLSNLPTLHVWWHFCLFSAHLGYTFFYTDLLNLAHWQMCFPGGGNGKDQVCWCRRHETQVRSLGQEDPLEEGMATHSSFLAWRIPWTEEPGGLQPCDCKELDMTSVTLHARTGTLTHNAEGLCIFRAHVSWGASLPQGG